VIDLRADLHGHVTDYASDLDRAWFEAHPSQDVRYRPAVDHEWCRRSVDDHGDCTPVTGNPPKSPSGMCWELMTEVVQLQPGTRVRHPYWVLAPCDEVVT
jgi:hypothetical protein